VAVLRAMPPSLVVSGHFTTTRNPYLWMVSRYCEVWRDIVTRILCAVRGVVRVAAVIPII